MTGFNTSRVIKQHLYNVHVLGCPGPKSDCPKFSLQLMQSTKTFTILKPVMVNQRVRNVDVHLHPMLHGDSMKLLAQDPTSSNAKCGKQFHNWANYDLHIISNKCKTQKSGPESLR